MSDESLRIIRGPDDVVRFLRASGVTGDDPVQIALGLAPAEPAADGPPGHAVCGAAVRSGTCASRPIDAAQLLDLAAELCVGAVVLATVGGGGARPPSRHEVTRFVHLRHACAVDGVALVDWVVLTARHWWSLRDRVIREAA